MGKCICFVFVSYDFLAIFIFNGLTKPPDVILLVFASAPSTAFDDNPHARNVQTVISEWDLTESRSWIPGFLQSMFYVGFMPGTILLGQFSDRYRRKKISLIDHSNYKLALLVFGKLGISGAFDLIYVYTAELFSTVVRNVGLGSMSFWARVGGVVAPFLANLAMFAGSTGPIFAFGITSLLCSVFAAFLPETRATLIPNTFEEAEQQERDEGDDYCN